MAISLGILTQHFQTNPYIYIYIYIYIYLYLSLSLSIYICKTLLRMAYINHIPFLERPPRMPKLKLSAPPNDSCAPFDRVDTMATPQRKGLLFDHHTGTKSTLESSWQSYFPINICLFLDFPEKQSTHFPRFPLL